MKLMDRPGIIDVVNRTESVRICTEFPLISSHLQLTDPDLSHTIELMSKGRLIVFEGIDGSGKTTQSKTLFQHLTVLGFDCRWFREPGDSPAGKRIRELALSREQLSAEDELALFVTDRRENVRLNLRPNLEAGRIVILDRYYFSSTCYQGARGLDMDAILKLHEEFVVIPDLAVYIDVDVVTALERIRNNRSERAVRFEIEDFLVKVRKNYLQLCDRNLLQKVDGNRDRTTVWEEIRPLCEESLKLLR